MVDIQLEVYDHFGQQFIVNDAEQIKYSNHYSPQGSGFGFLQYTLLREPNLSYADTEQSFEVKLRKGLRNILFHGIITKIQENTDGKITVSCVGYNTVLSLDIRNFIICDNRVTRWIPGCNPSGSFRPDKFDVTNNWQVILNEGLPTEVIQDFDGVSIAPRNGVDYNTDDYAFSRFRFPFGETVEHIKFDWELQLPNSYPGRIEMVDANDPENILFSKDVSGNGSEDIFTTFSGPFVELRFVAEADGLNTSDDGTVYGRIFNIVVYSVDDDPVDAAVVARNVDTYMETTFGFSNDQSLIEDIGFELVLAAYDTDARINESVENAASFGSLAQLPVIWGTWFDDTKRMFMQEQDTTTIRYIIPEPEHYSVSGDVLDTYQKVYGKFRDKTGVEIRTGVIQDNEIINALGGLFRKEVIDYGDSTQAQVDQALQVALDGHKDITIKTSFNIPLFLMGTGNQRIPVEDLRSGGVVQIPIFQVREVAIQADKTNTLYSFLLAKVEVDLDSNSAKLTPVDDIQTFDKYLEQLQRLVKGE